MSSIWGRSLGFTLIICLIVPIVTAIPIYPGNFTAHFIDVGQGDAIFIITPANDTLLIDSGDTAATGSKVSNYIDESGLNLDIIVATHSDADHIGGMLEVLEGQTPARFFDSPYPKVPWTATYQNMRNKINQTPSIQYRTADAGDYIPLDPAVNISVLSPTKKFTDVNDNSVVLLMKYDSINYLFMGDAGKKAEPLIPADVHAEILKVGHHGSSSASSPAFLARVDPKVAVIEVGAGNSYGHPTNVTLANLIAAGARIYRTDYNGTVVITTDGSSFFVKAENDPVVVPTPTTTIPTPVPTPNQTTIVPTPTDTLTQEPTPTVTTTTPISEPTTAPVITEPTFVPTPTTEMMTSVQTPVVTTTTVPLTQVTTLPTPTALPTEFVDFNFTFVQFPYLRFFEFPSFYPF